MDITSLTLLPGASTMQRTFRDSPLRLPWAYRLRPFASYNLCCNTASESGGDLRGQQFTETSPTDYLSKGPATTSPDPER